jgi:SCP-2 sterol transfer family
MKGFRSAEEFKTVFEHIFELMNEHPEVGRPLRDAHAPHRFEITDLGLEFNVNAADPAEERAGRFLRWVWGPPDWEPVITMKMSSETANRFFQGKENIALAVAMGRVKLKGPMSTILKLAPVTNPIHAVYRDWLEESGHEHLVV